MVARFAKLDATRRGVQAAKRCRRGATPRRTQAAAWTGILDQIDARIGPAPAPPSSAVVGGTGQFREGGLGRLVVKLGDLPTGIAPVLIFGSLAVFIGGIVVEDKLVLQTDPVEWVNQESQVIEDLDRLQAETDSSSELGMFVQSDDIFDDTTVGFVDEFAKEQLDEYEDELLTASSIVTTVSFLMEIPGAGDVPPLGAEVEAAFAVAPADIQKSTADPDAGALNLIFRTGAGDLNERAVVVRDVRDTVDPPEGVSATPSGLAVVGVGLLDNLEENRILLTYLAILFVFLFLTVRLRSVVRALLSMVPVLIAVGAASLVAYALDLKLSPLTAVGGPLVVAVCTEFTSLILLRFVEERRRGWAPKAAVDVTASRTGRAFIVSAMTATAGVGVIATSSLPLLRDFGLIVAMNVAVALLSALVFLPPMLVWADQRNWVSRGLVPDDDPRHRHRHPRRPRGAGPPARAPAARSRPGVISGDPNRTPKSHRRNRPFGLSGRGCGLSTLGRWRKRHAACTLPPYSSPTTTCGSAPSSAALLGERRLPSGGRGQQRQRDDRTGPAPPARRRRGRPRDGGLRRAQHGAGAAGAGLAPPGDRDLEPLRSAARDRGDSAWGVVPGEGRGRRSPRARHRSGVLDQPPP